MEVGFLSRRYSIPLFASASATLWAGMCYMQHAMDMDGSIDKHT